MVRLVSVLFCFKQKTAYELRISDWSSDLCSSDLAWIALASNEGEAMKAIFIRHGESTGNAGMPCHDLATIEATNRRARLPRACPKPTPQYHVTYTRTRQSAALLIAFPRRAGRDVAHRR